jgi:hypothetical protein
MDVVNVRITGVNPYPKNSNVVEWRISTDMAHYSHLTPTSSGYHHDPVVVDCLSGDEAEFDSAALLDENVLLQREPLISRSAILITLLNLLCLSFTILWFIHNGFSVDLFSIALIVLSGCVLTLNCVIGARIFANVHNASMVQGRPEDFQDYVRRVTNPLVVHEKVAADYRRGLSFSRLFDWGKRVYV